MSKKYPGVSLVDKKKKNGPWFFRIKRTLPSGKSVDMKRKLNKLGMPFDKAEDAYHEMCEVWEELVKTDGGYRAGTKKKTVGQVFEEFKSSKEASTKATGTIRKHNSVWENHIKAEFEKRGINSVTTGEINAFLADKYKNGERSDGKRLSYEYIESFVKFFYLVYGYAQSKGYISLTKYNTMFENNNTKIKMPDRRPSDKKKTEPETYTEEQLAEIKAVLSEDDGLLLPAFYIARYTGMRVSEVFALRWTDVNFKEKRIHVRRQLAYENGIYELMDVKTKHSVRDILMPDELLRFLQDFRKKQLKEKAEYGLRYRDVGKVIDTVDNKELSDSEKDFINRRKDGKLVTQNDVKKYAKILSSKGIQFHFHALRHTYATDCAAHNMSELMLMEMMGHEKIDTTKQYYINTRNEKLVETTFFTLNEAMKPISDPTVGYAASQMLDEALAQIPTSGDLGDDEYRVALKALSRAVPDIASGKYTLEPLALDIPDEDGAVAKTFLPDGTVLVVKENK